MVPAKKNSHVFSDDDPLSMVRRSMLYACGLTHREILEPQAAIVNTYNDMHPGHIHLKPPVFRIRAGVRYRDTREIDMEARRLELHVPEEELTGRQESLVPPSSEHPHGYLDTYRALAAPASRGGIIIP